MFHSLDQIDGATMARYRADPCAFIEENLISPYDGQPYKLIEAERAFIRHAFKFDSDGRLLYPLWLFGAIKKSRKSELAELLALTVAVLFGGKHAEIYICANSLEQAKNRCFSGCKLIIEASPLLKREAVLLQDKICFYNIQSTIFATSSNAAGIAGGHPAFSVHDELWLAPSGERGRAMFDQLIPVPSRKFSARLVVSHAGFADDDHLLYQLYQRSLKLPEVDKNLRAGEGMVAHWSHTPLHPWQDEKWIAEMKRELPQHKYMHMIENRFVPSEAAYITPEMWDKITKLPGPRASDPNLEIEVAVDAGWKSDDTAIVALTLMPDGNVEQVYHKLFTPVPGYPLDFEGTIVKTILDLSKRFRVRRVVVDATQMGYVMQHLAKLKVKIEEQKQTAGSISDNFKTLYKMLRDERFANYRDAQLRDIATRVVFEETGSGLRLAKHQVVQKDYITALAMGCFMITQAAGNKYPGYDRLYRAWDPLFEDEDLPKQQPPVPEPELLDYIPTNLAEWWRWKGATRQQPTYGSADRNLLSLYQALAGPPFKN